MQVSSVGIIGAGVMGCGVAQTAAVAGFTALLYDHRESALHAVEARVREGVRAYNFYQPKGAKVDAKNVLGRITLVDSLEAVAGALVIVENVTENWDIKREVYGCLKPFTSEESVILVNTSAIPITRVASQCAYPARVAGVHFMNPLPLKPAVELIRGFHTSERTLEDTRGFLKAIGKKPIEVRDSPGFVSNRVLMLTINEAIFLLQESVADAKSIDAVFKDCFGHPMGPLETSDLIGNDTILYSLEMLLEGFHDPKFRPCPLLTQMVDAGLLGRKSGKGFYSYN